MLNRLLSLINSRQRQLYEENKKLHEENKRLYELNKSIHKQNRKLKDRLKMIMRMAYAGN